MDRLSSIKPSPTVLFQELEEEAVLLDLANEQYYGLDEVGTRIWQLFWQCHDVGQVMTQMLTEYNVPEATLHQDLTQLIHDLADAGLVTVAAV
jgi:hypothetical protein